MNHVLYNVLSLVEPQKHICIVRFRLKPVWTATLTHIETKHCRTEADTDYSQTNRLYYS